MTEESTVVIGLLLPDVLGTYSDSGNALVLAQRLRWRGVAARVLRCNADRPPPQSCDIYVIGGGEDAAQLYAARWLCEQRALRHTLAGSAVTLAVCAGMQILGNWLTAPDGARHPGAELLDLTTQPARRRVVGEVVTDCTLPGVGVLTGFENHGGASSLGKDAQPLGRVITGIGNGDRAPGHRGVEGAVAERIVATYLHGPVLARNPALADYLLRQVIGRQIPTLEVPDELALRDNYLAHLHRRPIDLRRRSRTARELIARGLRRTR